MKKARKYLKISWLVFLIILVIWSITGLQLFRNTKVRFGTSYANQSIALLNSDALFSYFESLYGLGPRYFLNLETEKIYSESELPQGTTFFVNADIRICSSLIFFLHTVLVGSCYYCLYFSTFFCLGNPLKLQLASHNLQF